MSSTATLPYRIELTIDAREPFAAAAEFEGSGSYEYLHGRAVIHFDPTSSAYQSIVDLEHAALDDNGLVEYGFDFALLKPTQMAKGNRRLLYDVVNRGDKRALQFFNDAPAGNHPQSLDDAGNGFLLRRGYAIVWCGWQGDVLPGNDRSTISVPIASRHGDIVGSAREEIIVEQSGVQCVPLSGNSYTRSHPSVSLDTSTAQLTRRAHQNAAPEVIQSDRWHFAKLDSDGALEASDSHIYLAEGFDPQFIYEVRYTACRPQILGLGFTAVRDLVSYLRYGTEDDAGNANPLREGEAGIEKAYAWGRSQSGRYLREFVYRGWNADHKQRRVFDAVWPHVTGGGRLAMNLRFAHPDRYPRQHEHSVYPSDQFPFAYVQSTDPWSGRSDAILKRPDTDPLVMHTQTCSEYWQRRGSLVHTDAFGVDLPEHPKVRIYAFASSQHHAAPGIPAQQGNHQNLSNPLNTCALLRALLDQLDRWASDGQSPPASEVPRRADASLISITEFQQQFPAIPSVSTPSDVNRLYEHDYGLHYQDGIIDNEPPELNKAHEYAVLVPAVDADGNDIRGVRTPDVSVPRATYTGWNIRSPGFGFPAMYSIVGSYIPFATGESDRTANGDPRPSVEARYANRADYVARVAIAAKALSDGGFLLAEDLERYVARAIDLGEIPTAD